MLKCGLIYETHSPRKQIVPYLALFYVIPFKYITFQRAFITKHQLNSIQFKHTPALYTFYFK